MALALAVSLAPSSPAESVAGQEGGAGAEDTAKDASGDAARSVEETLDRLDELLARLDAQIVRAWLRAEEMLDLADAAGDPDEQMRLEELYGRMAALATSFEEQRSRLRTLRDELAAADRVPP